MSTSYYFPEHANAATILEWISLTRDPSTNSCPKVCALSFSNCERLTDAVLAEILRVCPNLTKLAVSNCSAITDSAFASVKNSKCEYLAELDLSGTNITHHSLEKILKKFKRLRSLHLSGCGKFTNSSHIIAYKATQVHKLYLKRMPADCKLDLKFFKALIKNFPALALLDVSDSDLTDEALTGLSSNRSRIEKLVVKNNSKITGEFLNTLTRTTMPSLKTLDVRGCANLDEKLITSAAESWKMIILHRAEDKSDTKEEEAEAEAEAGQPDEEEEKEEEEPKTKKKAAGSNKKKKSSDNNNDTSDEEEEDTKKKKKKKTATKTTQAEGKGKRKRGASKDDSGDDEEDGDFNTRSAVEKSAASTRTTRGAATKKKARKDDSSDEDDAENEDDEDYSLKEQTPVPVYDPKSTAINAMEEIQALTASRKGSGSTINLLYSELFLTILEYLELQDLGTIGKVCSDWRRRVFQAKKLLTTVDFRKADGNYNENYEYCQYGYRNRWTLREYYANSDGKSKRHFTNVTDSMMSIIVTDCPSLKHVSLSGCTQITDVGVSLLLDCCSSLESLDLSNCVPISSRCLVRINRPLYNMKRIDVRGCNVTEAFVRRMGEVFPSLESLSIRASTSKFDTSELIKLLRGTWSGLTELIAEQFPKCAHLVDAITTRLPNLTSLALVEIQQQHTVAKKSAKKIRKEKQKAIAAAIAVQQASCSSRAAGSGRSDDDDDNNNNNNSEGAEDAVIGRNLATLDLQGCISQVNDDLNPAEAKLYEARSVPYFLYWRAKAKDLLGKDNLKVLPVLKLFAYGRVTRLQPATPASLDAPPLALSSRNEL